MNAARTLGDVSLAGNVLRVRCAACGHSVAKMAHLVPGWPDTRLDAWRAKLWCSKCERHEIIVSECMWCVEMEAWREDPPDPATKEWRRLNG